MKNGLSCREAFCNELTELGRKNSAIVALTSDAKGSTGLGVFVDALPAQFVEVGIAEQNEVGMAAGMAAVGMRPYVCAPASFLSARCLEQIKIDVAYSRANVKILGVSGGISYGPLGSSHHSLHDVAAFRAFPGLRVILPCDAVETAALLRELEDSDEPAYIRVGKAAMPAIYEPGAKFTVGKAVRVRAAANPIVTVIACGEMVHSAIEAFEKLSENGLPAQVLDMHTLSPLDEDAIRAAADLGPIVTIEEHNVNGGLGAAVALATATHKPVPIRALALPGNENVIPGASPEVFRHYGLDSDGICLAVSEVTGMHSPMRAAKAS